ncbi:MAG TPA: PP2C family protein-serine/threonine phosphatase [Acidobacteriaceae bacterium]|nr:PP2C family protein-serine/threonine phosphatase [Acidobacteriaceae bacterium]HUB52104.1 PP2C family protein-serine/threonine phosphatase [Terracidiphilus sp.]
MRTTLLIAALLLVSRAVIAETPSPLPIDRIGQATVPMDGPWQFHPGDNPNWASPDFDDSGWAQIETGRTWEEQGFRNLTGFAWYRRSIVLGRTTEQPDQTLQLNLGLPYVQDSAEVYWNGRLIGRWGGLPPHPVWFGEAELGVAQLSARATFSMPLGAARSGVLAIRVWKAPYVFFATEAEGGLVRTPVLGTPAAIDAFASSLWFHWLIGNLFPLAVALLAGIASLLAFLGWLRDRRRRLLFWMALYILHPLLLLPYLTLPGVLSFRELYGTIAMVVCLEDVSLWFLLLYLLELTGNRRLVLSTRWLAAACILFNGLDSALQAFRWWEWPGHRFLTLDIAFTIPPLLMEAYPLVLIAFALRRHLDRSLWFLAITAALADFLQGFGIWATAGLRWTHWDFSALFWNPLVTVAGNELSPITIVNTLLLVAVVTAVWRYERQQRLRQLRDAEEFRNAQELQRVLIPSAQPEMRRFAVSSAYHPAQEVGGDFFQIVPNADDSVLVAIGDVSGKGLGAAMAVSLIVGTLRTLAEVTTDPAEVIAGLNRRLEGRLRGGFATCLVALLQPDGRCVFANAGHLPPFLNAHQVELPGALPLGLNPKESYENQDLVLAPGDRLTLYTDGLLEARDSGGELFGFERLAELVANTAAAEDAVAAGVQFGQEDDITVLTVTLAPSGVTARLVGTTVTSS